MPAILRPDTCPARPGFRSSPGTIGRAGGTWPRTEGVALTETLGPFALDTVTAGDCRKLVLDLPDDSIDVVVTSPPYWGQRLSGGNGVEADPRAYLAELTELFTALLPKLKPAGIAWINIGDAYNTPVNWRLDDSSYSTLGPARSGLQPENSAYTKPRHRRRAFTDDGAPWLRYGNLLGLPQRLMVALGDAGWLLRGEVIWRKLNPMPEGRCRRPHRQHEVIYLLARSERHAFRTAPPVGSVWEFSNERVDGLPHFSRFPEQLPLRCVQAYGTAGRGVVVLDPFSGSGTTGVAAIGAGCSFVGFEIDADQVTAANDRLRAAAQPRTEVSGRAED
jgi:DNA modification methylase